MKNSGRSSDAVRVLYVEDNEGDADLVRELSMDDAHRPIDLHVRRTMADAIRAVGDETFDIILLDLGLPDSTGFDTFERMSLAAPATPVLVLSGQDDLEVAARSIRHGAHDYLVKGGMERHIPCLVYNTLARSAAQGERDLARDRLAQVNRVLHAIRDVSQLIAHESDADRLVAKTSEILVKARGYDKVWIATGNFEESPVGFAQAGWGEDVAPLERDVTEGHWPPCRDLLRGPSPGLAMIAPGTACSCPATGLCRSDTQVVAELRHGERTYGLIGVSIPQSIPFGQEEEELLRELAGDLAFALHDLDLERRQREGERRFQNLFEGMEQGAVYQDPSGRILDANPAAERILGISRERLRGGAAADPRWHIIDEDGQRVADEDLPPIAALRMSQRKRANLGVFNRREQGYRWVTMHSVPEYREGDDRPFRVFSTFEDITDLREAREKLEASEKLLSETERLANVGGWMHDLTTGKAVWTRTLHEICEIPLDEEPPGPEEHLEFYPSPDREVLEQTYRRAVEEGKGFDLVLQGRTATGKSIWCRVRGEAVIEDGKCVALRGTLQDISAHKEAEAALETATVQLQQSQKIEAVGLLAGGIAHDFNNLMTVITGYAELSLRKLEGNPDLRHKIEEILLAGTRATELTRQLLAFSRKQVMRPKVLDLNEVIEGVKGMLQRLLGEDIRIVFRAQSGLAPVFVDRGQIEQVIVNLAVNARDAMPSGGKLTIETRDVELDEGYAAKHVSVKPGPYVLLAISDTGCGMDTETKERLFEPFFTTKGAGEGTGLGLSTAYGIVKQCDGNIWVYSEVGLGTTFKVYFPRSSATRGESQTPEEKLPPLGGAESVLVVEDDPGVRKVILAMLEGSGYGILSAASAAEALDVSRDHEGKIDLLLTDLVMPGMNGRELAKQLSKERPGTKVIFMSGYTNNTLENHGALDPDTMFIEKPFSQAAVTRRIRQVLDAPGSGRHR